MASRAKKFLACAFALGLPAPALAHHVMGGKTPVTLLQGLLSGLGHPIIGVDHLAFVIGIGIFAAVAGFGPLLPALFVAFMCAGLALHLASVPLPGAELLVALSIAAVGLAIAVERGNRHRWIAGALFAAAGTAHGFAFAESIIGAENGVLGAYVLGLVIVQTAIALTAYAAARAVSRSAFLAAPITSLRIAGTLILLCGSYFVLDALGLAG